MNAYLSMPTVNGYYVPGRKGTLTKVQKHDSKGVSAVFQVALQKKLGFLLEDLIFALA